MEKSELRKHALDLRERLNKEQFENKSESIMQHLKDYIEKNRLNCIASFASFQKEVSTLSINKWILESGYTLLLPRINTKEKMMEFYQVTQLDSLVKSKFGILEPDPLSCVKADYSALNCVITPGVVFDRLGYRIGYGGGFYDKFFSSLSNTPLRVGICFDLQVVKKVPAESFDQRVSVLITESGIILQHCV